MREERGEREREREHTPIGTFKVLFINVVAKPWPAGPEKK